jgi:hypothetical protein
VVILFYMATMNMVACQMSASGMLGGVQGLAYLQAGFVAWMLVLGL